MSDASGFRLPRAGTHVTVLGNILAPSGPAIPGLIFRAVTIVGTNQTNCSRRT